MKKYCCQRRQCFAQNRRWQLFSGGVLLSRLFGFKICAGTSLILKQLIYFSEPLAWTHSKTDISWGGEMPTILLWISFCYTRWFTAWWSKKSVNPTQEVLWLIIFSAWRRNCVKMYRLSCLYFRAVHYL